jgi:hypothetical protein
MERVRSIRTHACISIRPIAEVVVPEKYLGGDSVLLDLIADDPRITSFGRTGPKAAVGQYHRQPCQGDDA